MQPEFVKTFAGFAGATLASIAMYFADAMPESIQASYEGVTSLSIFGCLIYAIRHLNAERVEERRLREVDRMRWEDKWAAEHQQNIEAREADRLVRDKFATAVSDLAEAVKDGKQDRG